MTRSQWSERGFDLVGGPAGVGQLSALREAAEEVAFQIGQGEPVVSFRREGRAYIVETKDSSFHYTYSPL